MSKLSEQQMKTLLEALKNLKQQELSGNQMDLYNSKSLDNPELVKYFKNKENKIHDYYRELSSKLYNIIQV